MAGVFELPALPPRERAWMDDITAKCCVLDVLCMMFITAWLKLCWKYTLPFKGREKKKKRGTCGCALLFFFKKKKAVPDGDNHPFAVHLVTAY